MPCDFTVIMHRTVHVGDEPGLFGTAPYEGSAFSALPFACPNVNPRERAVLFFQSRDVDNPRSKILINGIPLFGGLPVSSTGGAESPIWNGNVALVERGVLKPIGNVLRLEPNTSQGGVSGDIDDVLIDNVVLMFKTRQPGDLLFRAIRRFLRELPVNPSRAPRDSGRG
jgi:hypothetical protein